MLKERKEIRCSIRLQRHDTHTCLNVSAALSSALTHSLTHSLHLQKKHKPHRNRSFIIKFGIIIQNTKFKAVTLNIMDRHTVLWCYCHLGNPVERLDYFISLCDGIFIENPHYDKDSVGIMSMCIRERVVVVLRFKIWAHLSRGKIDILCMLQIKIKSFHFVEVNVENYDGYWTQT